VIVVVILVKKSKEPLGSNETGGETAQISHCDSWTARRTRGYTVSWAALTGTRSYCLSTEATFC